MPCTYCEFGQIVDNLNKWGIDYKSNYCYKMYEKRQAGYHFSFEEHIKAMVYSLLSAQKPWVQVEPKLNLIDEIFKGYGAEYVKSEDPQVLISKVCAIGCGNKAIARQMQGLKHNVEVLEEIHKVSGDIDQFVGYYSPIEVSELLSSGRCKLNGFAQTLALQYLKNVGISTCKPDVHVKRILARLGYIPYEEVEIWYILKTVSRIAEVYSIPDIEVNEALWYYCATGYGEVCAATPKCKVCGIQTCISHVFE